jgi:hypothetical protein
LTLEIDAKGSVTGALKRQQGPDVSLVGQADGRAINLVFDLGDGQQIFGVGTGTQDIHTCQGRFRGVFSGPALEDIGIWESCSCEETDAAYCGSDVCGGIPTE